MANKNVMTDNDKFFTGVRFDYTIERLEAKMILKITKFREHSLESKTFL